MEKANNMNRLRPTTKRASLPPDNLTLDVTCFDFSKMLSALMNNTELNQLSNLIVNPTNPFLKYGLPKGKLGEVNSGPWYQTAYKNLVKDVNSDLLLPIIF